MQAATVRTGPLTTAGGRESALLPRLRRATADAHQRVESRLFPSALADRDSYGRMLRVLLALHEPVEQRLSTVDGLLALGIDPAQRRKAPWLRADLAQLGIDPPQSDPGSAEIPGIAEPASALPAALGAFYVLEGSTLGGRVLLDQVRARLGDVPTDFLTGYGADTARYWRGARAALVEGVRTAADPDSAAERLIDAAGATFALLDRLLDDEGWPTP